MLLPVITKLAGSVLLSAATLMNSSGPKNLSFDASAFVTVNKQVRVAVSKKAETPVTVLLRDANKNILFHQSISKNESSYAVKLNVNDLADGTYELEVKSTEGSIRKEFNLSTQHIQQSSHVVAIQ